MSDLRAFPRRFASQRRKAPATPVNTFRHDIDYLHLNTPSPGQNSIEDFSSWEEEPQSHLKAPGWLRRRMSMTFRHRRQTLDIPSRPATAICYPPALPETGTSGAAARAAAAAQNEIQDCLRKAKKERLERMVRGDAESGVGVDIRPGEIETTITRRDAESLVRSELVSRQWYSPASDPLVWKKIFYRDFRQTLTIPENASDFQVGQGLGNERADQNWKQMWKVRKALHQRWTDSHAAAIYLEGHYDSVYCVQFDEDKILTGSRDRTIRIWDARTFKCTRILGVPSRSNPITLSPLSNNSGCHPFTKLVSQQYRIESESTGRPRLYHVGSILCLQYDDELMITGSSDCFCIMWDIQQDWKPIRRVHYHNAGVLDICFDRKYVVSCSKDTTVCLWDRQTGGLIHQLTGHRGPVNAVQLRGNLAVSASGDGVAKLWNLLSGNCVKEFPSKDRGMACVEFSPDSLTIFAGGNDQVIYQFDASSGELLREFKGHSGLVRSLHLDSANGRVVSGSYDTSVRAYDVRTGLPIVEFTGWTTSWILSAKLNYRRIIATSQDSRVVVIDFGYDLPGIEMLERQYRPSVSSSNCSVETLRKTL
ncbi:MAG: hypothetical protein Q9182_000748 [Xanthomendoza sp. 2 TL-2023]